MDLNLYSFSRQAERISAGDHEQEIHFRSLPGRTLPNKALHSITSRATYAERPGPLALAAGERCPLGARARETGLSLWCVAGKLTAC
jgi:hypothetical protein